MDTQLNKLLSERGWLPSYLQYMPEGWEYTERAGRGEVEGKSPFPGSTDKRPSFAFSTLNGLWNDQHYGDRLVGSNKKGGTFVQFVAYMHFSELDNRGRLHGDFDAAERQIRIDFGMAQPIDEAWYQACRARLATSDSPYHQLYRQFKPWDANVVKTLGIGFDTETNRFVIPYYDKRGKLVNCKLYQPDRGISGPKTIWKVANAGPIQLFFPYKSAWVDTNNLVFVEGEPDVISLRSVGVPAVSGSSGANAVPHIGNPGSEFCAGRGITVWTDADNAGEVYGNKAAATFQNVASSVAIAKNPEWPGASSKRDVSDYIQYLVSQGNNPTQIHDLVMRVVNEAEQVGEDARYNLEPVDRDFLDSINPEHYGTRIRTKLRALSVGSIRNTTPLRMEASCRITKGKMCETCPMRAMGGSANIRIDPRSTTAMNISTVDDDKKMKLVKEHMNIPVRCDEVILRSTEIADVQVAQVGKSQTSDSLQTIAAEEAYSRRCEMIYIGTNTVQLEPGIDYEVTGSLESFGKNQRAILLVDKVNPLNHTDGHKVLTPLECAELHRHFNPAGYTIFDALRRSANDIARSVTGIRFRPDMHMLYRAVWYSAITFDMRGEHVSRGWLEAFVLGDTRCGKSAAFKAMTNHFSVGLLVDCKMQTVPGLLGAVETSTITGERFVLPGILPLNDKRGPIGFDEFSGPRQGRQTLIESLSSTRGEGVVSITKAAHARFKARNRSIWFANPGDGRLLAEIPGFGVERFKYLVGQPEDVARFDIAMAVTQQDVPIEILLRPIALEQPRIPRDAAILLLEWARSREDKDFIWEDDAIEVLANVTRRMIREYDQSIPLVENATQRLKIAKVAVANALATFSSPDGVSVVITAGHVEAAYMMFNMWYSKPSFGYLAYSQKKKKDSLITDEDEMRKYLEKEFGEHLTISLNNLLRTDSFTEQIFRVLCPVLMENQIGILRKLSQFRAIETDGGNKYRLTRAMIAWISRYLATEKLRIGQRADVETETTISRDRNDADRTTT